MPVVLSGTKLLYIQDAIGYTDPVSSITVKGGGTLYLNGGVISTTGNQTYNNSVVVGTDTAFNTVGSDTNIAFNKGVTGNSNVTVNSNSGSNTLTMNSGTTQTWEINGNNEGDISYAGFNGNFHYANIQNIGGGTSNNIFKINGSIDGAITGGSGNNTLILAGAGNNTVLFTDANTGIATGINGGFYGINNIVGNSNGNNYVFYGNSSIQNINAGTDTTGAPNTFDFSNYQGALTVSLGNDIFDGTLKVNDMTIGGYNNVNNLIGKAGENNVIYLPRDKVASITYTNPEQTAGYIGDPTYFSNFTVLSAPPLPAPPVPTPPVPNSPLPAPELNSTYVPASVIMGEELLPGSVLDFMGNRTEQLLIKHNNKMLEDFGKKRKDLFTISSNK
jgi:hypothetical protein